MTATRYKPVSAFDRLDTRLGAPTRLQSRASRLQRADNPAVGHAAEGKNSL